MTFFKHLRHRIILTMTLLSCTFHTPAQQSWEDFFTVYMLDPDGQFMKQLDTQIQNMVSLSNLTMETPRHRLMGNISLNYVGAITDNVDFYTISRPLKGNEEVDMDSTETYQLVVFKKSHVSANPENKSEYHFSRGKDRWFTLPYEASLYEHQEHQTMILSQGVINMLQIANTQPEVNKGNPHQFMEMIGGIARQADFIKLLEGHPNIIRLQKNSNDVLVAIPLLELYDNNLQDYLFSRPDITLTEVLRQMALLARAMEFMHSRGVAHGDIALENLLVRFDPDMYVAFANFERSSKVDAVSGPHTLGRKKFSYSNNMHHAPEIRFPAGYPKEWRYTSATLKGDIWSFGFMLASVVGLYPQTIGLVEQLLVNKPFYYYYTNHEGELVYNPKDIKRNIVKRSPLQKYMEHIESTQIETHGILSSIHEQQFGQLIKLINTATQFDPEQRPAAGAIADELERIIKAIE